MKKKPWLAAFLNVLVTGTGYLYVGKRTAFAVMLIISEVLAYFWLFSEPTALTVFSNPWVMMAGVLYWIAFAFDAYQEAKS